MTSTPSAITCPHCRREFELTAAITASIESRLRIDLSKDAEAQKRALDEREARLRAEAAEVRRRSEAVDAAVAERLDVERKRISEVAKVAAQAELGAALKAATEENAHTRQRLAEAQARELDLRRRERELEDAKKSAELDLARRLDAERQKIAEAARKEGADVQAAAVRALQAELERKSGEARKSQEAELALRQERAKLEDEKAALQLAVQRQIDAERDRIKADARKQADDENRLKAAEYEAKLAAITKQLQEAQRRAEQGSQQAQGEVLEIELESILKAQFPLDLIEPVPKGVHGGDVLQRVRDDLGRVCGTILWESKRTKNWQDGWLTKLRDDGRAAKADAVGLMSITMPSDICTFGHRDGVWVTSRDCVMGVATALRSALIQVAEARRAMQGQQGKMELVYHYLAGPQFRQRVEAIVEAFTAMQVDLEAEKKAITKLWAKREKQLERAALNTVGMHGDLAGIVGAAIPELDALSLPTLAASTDS